MKSELIHLLSKLKTDHPDFQNLIITTNGAAMACLRHGYLRFESLDALEAYAWPQADTAGRASVPASPDQISPSDGRASVPASPDQISPSDGRASVPASPDQIPPSRSSRPSVQPEIPTPPQ